jgi:hypothetical protein
LRWTEERGAGRGRHGFSRFGILAGAVPASAGETVIDGVVRVQNGVAPSEGLRTVRLEETWRAGGDEDDAFFGFIGQVLSDGSGNLYLMDTQLSEVHVYSPGGEPLRTLSREGEGPGETRSPGDMFFLPNGRVALVQTFPGKIVAVDREGSPAGGLSYDAGDPGQGRFAVLVRGLSRGGNIVLAGIQMVFGGQGTTEQTYFLSSCDETGSEKHRYFAKGYAINYADFVLDEAKMDFVWGRVDLAPDGRIYAAPVRNAYEIHVLAADGAVERIIERDYESLKRGPEQRESARRTLEAVGNNYPVKPREITIEDTDPDVSALHVLDDGTLWVRTSRADFDGPDGTLTTYDVFDPAGRFIEQVALAGPGDAREDAIYLLSRDRAVVVTGALDAYQTMQGASSREDEGEVAPLEVICYRLGG